MKERLIPTADLEKLFDVLLRAEEFHRYRDLMNAQVHLASQVRFSPLTVELSAALDRLKGLLA